MTSLTKDRVQWFVKGQAELGVFLYKDVRAAVEELAEYYTSRVEQFILKNPAMSMSYADALLQLENVFPVFYSSQSERDTRRETEATSSDLNRAVKDALPQISMQSQTLNGAAGGSPANSQSLRDGQADAQRTGGLPPSAPERADTSYIASRIHYPEHWNTMAYPTLADALWELHDQSKFTCQCISSSQPSKVDGLSADYGKVQDAAEGSDRVGRAGELKTQTKANVQNAKQASRKGFIGADPAIGGRQ